MNIVEFLSKANLKKGGVILNAPQDLAALFVKKGFSTTLPKDKSDVTILFLRNTEEFTLWMNIVLPKVAYDSNFWICFPKGSSGIKSNINKDLLYKMVEEKGVKAVKQMAVNETWSALRMRPAELVSEKMDKE